MEDSIPETPRTVEVGVGELAVARHPDTLTTAALGSCVGVAVWDPFTLNGGLAHVMLPRRSDAGDGDDSPGRFARSAVPMLVDEMRDMGSPRRRLIAKIAGGAAMFRMESGIALVGERNLEEVRYQLQALGIPIRGEDVGGSHARTVELRLDSGTLIVRTYAFGVKEL